MPPSRRSKALTQYRRARSVLREISWWAVIATVLAVLTVAYGMTDAPIRRVAALGLAGTVFAVLSLKEQT